MQNQSTKTLDLWKLEFGSLPPVCQTKLWSCQSLLTAVLVEAGYTKPRVAWMQYCKSCKCNCTLCHLWHHWLKPKSRLFSAHVVEANQWGNRVLTALWPGWWMDGHKCVFSEMLLDFGWNIGSDSVEYKSIHTENLKKLSILQCSSRIYSWKRTFE